jgi:transposase
MDNPDDAVPNDTPQRQTTRATQWTHVQQLHQAGQSQRAIARELGLHRRTVTKYLLADQAPAPSQRRPSSPSSIWPYADHVRQRTQDGATMRTIWHELQQQGYGGSYSSVRRFVQRHTTPPAANGSQPRRRRHLSARQTRSLLLTPADALHHDTLALRERLEAGCADLADTGARARDLLRIIRQQDASALEPWLTAAEDDGVPEMQAFAASLRREYAAVHAALTESWSTGPVEGHITKLKLLKRAGYGRAKRDLLEARLVAAA